MLKHQYYIFLSISLLLFGCGELSFPLFFDRGVMLAKVGDNELYLDDLSTILTEDMSREDSLVVIDNFVDQWSLNKLKVVKAQELFDNESEDIERLIQEYRERLLTNKFDNHNSVSIDTLVTENQINDYYNREKNLFYLSSPVVKGAILVYPKGHRSEKELLKLVYSKKDRDRDDLVDIVQKNGFSFLEFNSWSYFTAVLENIPFRYKDLDGFLKRNSDFRITYEENEYVMVISSYKNSGDITPLEMVSESIKQIIINGRRKESLEIFEDTLYRNAVENGVVYINNQIFEPLDTTSVDTLEVEIEKID